MLWLFIINCYGIIFISLIITPCNCLEAFVTHHFGYSKVCYPSHSFWHKHATFLAYHLGVSWVQTKKMLSLRLQNCKEPEKTDEDVAPQTRQKSSHKRVVRVDFTICLLSCIIDRLITTCTSGKKICPMHKWYMHILKATCGNCHICMYAQQ